MKRWLAAAFDVDGKHGGSSPAPSRFVGTGRTRLGPGRSVGSGFWSPDPSCSGGNGHLTPAGTLDTWGRRSSWARWPGRRGGRCDISSAGHQRGPRPPAWQPGSYASVSTASATSSAPSCCFGTVPPQHAPSRWRGSGPPQPAGTRGSGGGWGRTGGGPSCRSSAAPEDCRGGRAVSPGPAPLGPRASPETGRPGRGRSSSQ